jgi:hypothetical protein
MISSTYEKFLQKGFSFILNTLNLLISDKTNILL